MGQFDKNLTGEQIQHVLDSLLYNALHPIVENTYAFDAQLAYIITLVSRNRKRKICSTTRDKAINYLSTALYTNDLDLKIECIKKSKIERLFIHSFVSKVIGDNTQHYASLYDKVLRCSDPHTKDKLLRNIKVLERQACCYDSGSLFPIYTTSLDYLNAYFSFRANILDHYIKSVSKAVSSYMSNNSHGTYDYSDVRQNMLKGVLTAIDKYDSSKGALTSYINWWLLNAQTCNSSEHEYGIAYIVPQTHKKKMAKSYVSDVNFSVSLDSLSSEGEDVSLHNILGSSVRTPLAIVGGDQQEYSITSLVKKYDIDGIARLYLNIEEQFSDNDKLLMVSRMEKDFGFSLSQDDKKELLKL